MQLLRYTVRQLSPWGTAPRSDTLCGIVLTRLAERSGDDACRTAIDAFRAGDPPFVLSSLLPFGMVFAPRLPPLPRALFRGWVDEKEVVDANGTPLHLFDALAKFKTFRKAAYLPLDVWCRHARALSLKPLFSWFCKQAPADEKKRTHVGFEPHVTIDRLRGTAMQGGLFFNRLTWFDKDSCFHLYARAKDPAWLLDMLQEVGDLGFGQDASTGKGRFSVTPDTSFDPAPVENAGPHALLCSVCATQNMTGLDGWYALEAKRGKAGPLVSNPHKATLLLLREGSVLRTLPAPPYVLEDVNADAKIVQITQPLILPCRLSEEDLHA